MLKNPKRQTQGLSLKSGGVRFDILDFPTRMGFRSALVDAAIRSNGDLIYLKRFIPSPASLGGDFSLEIDR
jgi:hypothetical protein